MIGKKKSVIESGKNTKFEIFFILSGNPVWKHTSVIQIYNTLVVGLQVTRPPVWIIYLRWLICATKAAGNFSAAFVF